MFSIKKPLGFFIHHHHFSLFLILFFIFISIFLFLLRGLVCGEHYTPYPKDKILVNIDHFNNNCGDCVDTHNYFNGKQWFELIENNKSMEESLRFLNHNAWYYFLPAYLIENINEESFDINQIGISDDFKSESLTDSRKKLINWQKEKFNQLSKIQIEQIIFYIELGKEYSDYVNDLVDINLKSKLLRKLRFPRRDSNKFRYIRSLEFWKLLYDDK